MISKTRNVHGRKKFTKYMPTLRYVDPDFVYLPLTNSRCPEYELYKEIGDYVKIGEIIGLRKASFFEQYIHSTVSGQVKQIVKKFHRSGKLIECVEIENDKKDIEVDTIKKRSCEEINNLTREDYIKIIKDASLVGLGGSGFPTYIKLQTKDKINYVLINGIECEPYLTSDYKLMVEMPERIIKGLRYAMKALDCSQGIICIKSKYEEAYSILTHVLKRRYSDVNITVKKVGNYFPQGWEIEMIKSALNVKIPIGDLPTKHGIMVLNVSTIVGFYRAVRYNEPVIKRNFTVSGDGIKYPQNFRLRIGTQIKDLINLCDGYTDDCEEKIFVMGGPMMGQNCVRDDAIVSKTSTSVIIINKENYLEEPCIRCASCVYSCPVELMPVKIMNLVKSNNIEGLKHMDIKKCIECGLCTYTCTSKIHLLNYVRQAKRMVK